MQTRKKVYGIALALTCGLAVTLKAQNLFIGNLEYNTIGEYSTSGATVNASLISGLAAPWGIAISGNNLFVANFEGGSRGTIGEYTTSGMTVNASLISAGLNGPSGIAISGNDLFVANEGYASTPGGVGEYTTSGATVNASLIPGGFLYGIAISGNDMFILNDSNGTVGEYTTSGAPLYVSISGLGPVGGIAVSSVPEPTAGALATLGAAALWLWRRRK